MSISANKYVVCSYELYVGGENERTLMEEATAERPLEYIHGMGMMLPDFEKNLFGLKAGDTFDFVLTQDQAYGEPSEDNVVDLPKDLFTNDEGVFDAQRVVVGNPLPMYTPDGHTVTGIVLEVGEESVRMDFNHPLAGETLHFIGKVLDEHEATNEEIEKFFGNHGGGCGSGCGCGSSDDEDGAGGCCGGSCGC